MAAKTVGRLQAGWAFRIILALCLMASLAMLADSVRRAGFGELSGQTYSLLWVLNALAVLLLAGLLVSNLLRLRSDLRKKVLGSRLTLRLVAIFAILSVAPALIVFVFSVQFIQDGINRWFESKVDNQLETALELSRAALDLQMRAYKQRAESVGRSLTEPDPVSPVVFDDYRQRIGAVELALFSGGGAIEMFSTEDMGAIVPSRTPDAAFAAIRQSHTYVAVSPNQEGGLEILVVLPLTRLGRTQSQMLQARFPVSDRLHALTDSVQLAYREYKLLSFLKEPLALTFIISLGVVLLVTLLAVMWIAFFAARRLVEPVRELADGTRAVAQGDYGKQLSISSHDELGFLVASFNAMTRRIAQARNDVERSQHAAEAQKGYLEAVLRRLSSGVLTLDGEHILRTVNPAASQILAADLSGCLGMRVDEISARVPYLDPLCDVLSRHITGRKADWREQIGIVIDGERRELLCRGSMLPDAWGGRGGNVVVFDDLTQLLQAQKDAAWGEVARRLAHEIRNPLTPIQLSAERLQLKLNDALSPEHQQMLRKGSETIIHQVDQMKRMVAAFAEYARAPELELTTLSLNDLIDEVVELYRHTDQGLLLRVDLDAGLPAIRADAGRIRQLLHNLLKNAVEALESTPSPLVTIITEARETWHGSYVELIVFDNGPGFPEELLGPVFEPYVSTKERGTGLGLAIVRKIVEEHGGSIAAQNRAEGGAQLSIRFPALQARVTGAEKG